MAKGNSEFCGEHHRDKEAMLYQAQRDGEAEAFNHIMSDPNKADMALKKFKGGTIWLGGSGRN